MAVHAAKATAVVHAVEVAVVLAAKTAEVVLAAAVVVDRTETFLFGEDLGHSTA